jgi:hypothetical protein
VFVNLLRFKEFILLNFYLRFGGFAVNFFYDMKKNTLKDVINVLILWLKNFPSLWENDFLQVLRLSSQ